MSSNFAEDRPAAGATGTLTFEQTGRGGPMIGLCIKILIFSIITLTIYRFWGRTQVRRYLWGHTLINGEPLDYLGKGSELLIGFIIALFVYILPLIVALNAIFIVWPPDESGNPALASLPWMTIVYAALFYLILVGLYQALRYRFSRTVWRGIRFSLTGSAFGFGLKYLMLAALNILTLGLLTPVVDLALFRSIATNTRFGDKTFRFEGKARQLYAPFLLVYGLIIAFGIGFCVLMEPWSHWGGVIVGQTLPEEMKAQLPALIGAFLAFYLLIILASVFYTVQSLRVKGRGLRFEGLSFKLDATTLSFLWLMISNLFIVLLSFGIFLPITELRSFRYIFRRLSATGTVDLAKIGPSTGPRPRFGEGLAEAFGMGNV